MDKGPDYPVAELGPAMELGRGRDRHGAAAAAWASTVTRTKEPPAPSRFAATLFKVLAAMGFVVTLVLMLPTLNAHLFAEPGGLMTALGRVTGLVGTYFLLITVLFIGRIPSVERVLGHDRLVRWHRVLGPWILILLGAHALFITLGYAAGARTGSLHEIYSLIVTFPGMLAAAAGLGLLVMAGATSYRYVRRKMKYETWWAVHLYTYLAAALSFTHQITSGTPFIGHPLAKAYWIALWAFTAGMVITYRFGLPLLRSLRHKLTVVSVEEESPGVVSIVSRGRHLDRLPVNGGQFLHWRFMTKDMWWQAHPYSLSAMPSANEMRITVKSLGDHSSALAGLEPGTPVVFEGPYGAFTKHARKTDRVLLVGAGVGATPLRALLDDLPRHVDVDVILRGRNSEELVLRDEIAMLVGERAGRLHEVVGSRDEAPLDAAALRRLVPDVKHRDVFICGPGGFMDGVIAAAREAGVPPARIHHEDFSF